MKTAIFRFEASPKIGAGHAMRSCVIADALTEKGWICKIVTSAGTYGFIKNLKRFERVDPSSFYCEPFQCDLLVIDHYDLNEDYEKRFRSHAKKVMVIDDLASRKHDCDILVDQTYGREADDYRVLVPTQCKILAGSDYVLLRKEFIELRHKALEKRKRTKEIKRILISMGGSDPYNYTQEALELVQAGGFKGALDIVLGFCALHLETIREYVQGLPNECFIHTNANMAQLIYEVDLAIGAAGSSVWERCYLGLPSILIQTAENQKKIYTGLLASNLIFESISPALFKLQLDKKYTQYARKLMNFIDGSGVIRIAEYLK